MTKKPKIDAQILEINLKKKQILVVKHLPREQHDAVRKVVTDWVCRPDDPVLVVTSDSDTISLALVKVK